MIRISRVVVPLMFLAEGVSYHSFLLDMTGGELLTLAYVLSVVNSAEISNIVFLMTLSVQILISVFFGKLWWSHLVQLTIGLLSLHLIKTGMSVRRQHQPRQQDYDQMYSHSTLGQINSVMMSELKESLMQPTARVSRAGTGRFFIFPPKIEVNDMQKKFVSSVLTGRNDGISVKGNDKRKLNGVRTTTGAGLRQRK